VRAAIKIESGAKSALDPNSEVPIDHTAVRTVDPRTHLLGQTFYNERRPRFALDRRTPDEAYFGARIIGAAA
jgi:hypothetical protein